MDGNGSPTGTRDEFHTELADYLKASGSSLGHARFERMQEKYPWDVREDGRVEFFPDSRGGYLVDPPERSGYRMAGRKDNTEFEDHLAEYLNLEGDGRGGEALEVLSDMRGKYENRWMEEDTHVRFFPEGYVSTKVAIPSLSSMASYFNDMGPGNDDREEVREFLDRNYYRTGTLSVSIYSHEDDSYLLDEGAGSSPEMVPFDHLAEEYPLRELLDDAMVAEDEARSELMEILWEYYYTGDARLEDSNLNYSVLHDPRDETVVLWRIGGDETHVEGEEVFEKLQAWDGGSLYNDVEVPSDETVFERLFNPGSFGWEGARG